MNQYYQFGIFILEKSVTTVVLTILYVIITTGKTIAEGFNALYYFEKAAETYLTALSTNKELNIVSHEVAEKTAKETANYPIDLSKLHLDQIKLILDKEEPDYKK